MNRNWYRGIIGMEDCITGKCKADRGFCLLHISLPPQCICGGEEADTDALFDLLREATLRMKDGKSLKTVGFQAGGSAADCEVGYEFALPVDRTEIAAIEIGGQELLLQP